MAATAAVNRPPPAHPGPIIGNLNSHPNSGIPNSGLQDQGLHGTSQDPGPQHPHVSARPVFYVPVPPPPPFLHYQWPMPFSYNPFTGFPGMGYGMVMPPFPPPPPYMEAPAYVLPHPHIQPVDYRRLLQPLVHAPSAPYQHPNQTRRVRPPHTVPVRETVNSEVQTEPTQRGVGGYGDGSPLISSDSGHGTTSNSPSSSSTSSQKQGSSQAENCSKESQVKRSCESATVTHGFNIPHPAGTKTVRSCIGATPETQKSHRKSVGQENVPLCRNGHCNMWSVDSPDSMVPVCSSSQQEDEVIKERRVSVPDILMSWGGGTPQAMMLKMADKVLPKKDHKMLSSETEAENEKSVYQSPAGSKNGPVVADNNVDIEGILRSKDIDKGQLEVLKLPSTLHELLSESKRERDPSGLVGLPSTDELLHSLDESQRLPDNEQEKGNETNSHAETTEIIPYQMSLNSFQMKKKMNESVWSVESLAPYIPKEWLQQNAISEPEVIIEMMEQDENGGLVSQNDNLIAKTCKERRQSCRFSSSDSMPMSDSWLVFSTPAAKLSRSKKPEMESEIVVSEMREPEQGQSMTASEKVPLASPTQWQSGNVSPPTKENADEHRSSEPEAHQSPNQESFIVNEQKEKSPCSPEREETPLSKSAEKEKISPLYPLILHDGVAMEADEGACRNNDISHLRNEQLCVPVADQTMADVSPSRRQGVDCGVQCTVLQEHGCDCGAKSSMGPEKRPFKYSDVKKGNDCKAEGFCPDGQMQKHQRRNFPWRNRGQEKQNGQRDTYNGYYSKPGRSRGGNGRNPRY